MSDTPDFFAEERRKLEQLQSELAAQSLVEIIGVLIPGSGGGVQYAWSDRWFIHAGFHAWRVRGGVLRRDRLRLNRACSEKHMIELSKQLPEETIVAVRARLCESNVSGTPQAMLEQVLGPVTDDADLNAVRVELLEPVVYVDAILGKLTLNRRLERYNGEVLWRGTRVEIDLSAEGSALPADGVTMAHELLRDQARWHEAALERAVLDLLEIKNEHWINEGQPPLTGELFRAHMKLQSIDVGSEGSVSFWFDDGDLFWGHHICVSGSMSEGFTDAVFQG